MRPQAGSRWRRPVLAALALVTVALTAQIPGLSAVFAPEALVPPPAGEEARLRRLLDGFPEPEVPLLVLVEASDVLAEAPLRHLHRMARHLTTHRAVERVDGLTTTPFPRPSGPDREVTLDTVDHGEEGSIDDSFARLVATDVTAFPMGLLSLSERTGGGITVAPLVEGELDADELASVRAMAASPLLEGRLVSADSSVAVLAVVGGDEEAVLEHARRWIDANPAPDGVRVRVAGLPVVRAEMVQALRGDQVVLVALAVLGSLLVLALGFRSWAGVLLPLGAAGMTSGIVVGAMALLGEPLNLLNNVVPPLLITVGLGDAVHLFVRYREELTVDGDRALAARRTLRAMGLACLLTTITTAVGFGSLVLSETEVVRRFAVTAALGVVLAYIVTITFLPAALPDFRSVGGRALGRGLLHRFVDAHAGLALRRPRLVVALATALLAAWVAIGWHVRVDSALFDHVGAESVDAVARLEDGLGGVRRVEIVLAGEPGRYHAAPGLRELERLDGWLEAQPEVLRATSAVTTLEGMWAYLAGPDASPASSDPTRAEALVEIARESAPALLARWVSADGARARVEVRLANESERTLNALFDRVEAHLAALPVEAALAGEAHRSARGLDRLVRDLLPSLALAVVVIFVLLGVLFRSPRVALVSVLPNVLPLAAALAYMALRGIPLHAGTAIVFTVSIGLVVDGTIHVLARHREERKAGRSGEEAVLRAVRGSGRAVVIGGLTLTLGFAALLFASFVPIRWFAELSLVAILVALPADLLVLPALLALFGPRGPAAPQR